MICLNLTIFRSNLINVTILKQIIIFLKSDTFHNFSCDENKNLWICDQFGYCLLIYKWVLTRVRDRLVWNSRRKQSFFLPKPVTSTVFDKKSSNLFCCKGLVEISSKTRSLVAILILGHPVPYLMVGTLQISKHFRN